MSLVHTVGLFWEDNKVFWGHGNQAGALLGVPSQNVLADPIDFRDQLGVYVLYADYTLVYVGQAGGEHYRLLHRLRQHRTDDLAGRWNRFSWFGLRRVLESGTLSSVKETWQPTRLEVLNHLEAVLIHAAEPRLNRQGGRFGEEVARYLQVRDQRLGPSCEEMIRELYKNI